MNSLDQKELLKTKIYKGVGSISAYSTFNSNYEILHCFYIYTDFAI